MGARREEQVPRRDVGRGDEREHACHCQGHRMAIVIGKEGDADIRGARDWIAGLAGVDHKVWYPASDGNAPQVRSPHVPDATGRWRKWKPPAGARRPRIDEAISPGDAACCYFEEVMVISHGSQDFLVRTLIDHVREILHAKPVKRFTLWACRTTGNFYPRHANNERAFEKLAFALAPPASCPCGCDPAKCNARPSPKCPHALEPTVIVSAAFHQVGNKHYASKLGLDPGPPARLTSPDGRVLRTTVTRAPNGDLVTETDVAPVGTPVFNGIASSADARLGGRTGPAIDPAKRAGKAASSLAVQPRPNNAGTYDGPTACPTLDGCLHGP